MGEKVGIITFHGAHNYGSSLQAYALKETYANLGADCEIINFRSPAQKDQYTPFTKRKGFKYFLKNLFFLFNYRNRKEKYNKFENFINTKLLNGQREYSSLEELVKNPPEYDLYVCGSDQIWNTAPNDASMAYFLPFVKGKKVSYAPSFGPIGNVKNQDEITEYLRDFDMISVREKHGQDLIKSMVNKDAPILIDPTLLLKAENYNELCSERLIKREYIFFYSLFSSKEMIKEVKLISKKLGLPVVVSNISNQNDLFTGFIRSTDAGPSEFISLIKNAKLVVTSSFHGTVFSILYNKPFLAVNGMSDKRISTLLTTLGMQQCAFQFGEGKDKVEQVFSIDFTDAESKLEIEREKAKNYIKSSLEL